MSANDAKAGQVAVAEQTAESTGDYLQNWLKRVRGGDIGSLPIIVGLVIIALVFQSLNQNYLTPVNFVNLIIQMAGIATIAIGVVFVLLLGEIDLSIGYVSAVCGVIVTMSAASALELPVVRGDACRSARRNHHRTGAGKHHHRLWAPIVYRHVGRTAGLERRRDPDGRRWRDDHPPGFGGGGRCKFLSAACAWMDRGNRDRHRLCRLNHHGQSDAPA